MTIAAIVLANGLSRRMGREKAGLELAGETLAARAVRRAAANEGVVAVALNCEGDPSRFTLDAPHVPDAFAGNWGPLSGVLAGMEWAAACGCDRVVSIAVDTPFFPDDLVPVLAASNAPIVVASSVRPQPVFALWNVSLAGDLRAWLEGGGRKIMAFVEHHRFETRQFEAKAGGPDPFFNINTPEDYEKAKGYVS